MQIQTDLMQRAEIAYNNADLMWNMLHSQLVLLNERSIYMTKRISKIPDKLRRKAYLKSREELARLCDLTLNRMQAVSDTTGIRAVMTGNESYEMQGACLCEIAKLNQYAQGEWDRVDVIQIAHNSEVLIGKLREGVS